MEYIELRCTPKQKTEGQIEILSAVLGELGFESFIEDKDDLLAYIQSHLFSPSLLDDSLVSVFHGIVDFSWNLIPDQNWNRVWEENFQPVTINGQCRIRAPFHAPDKQIEYEIIIEPKMSFGTAHHETTAGMIKFILATDMKSKKVLDMGCGTGVLAILAAKKGATTVTAIDNDEWAYNNTIENCQRNNVQWINVYLSDASLLSGEHFDIILANINRNILLQDIPVYAGCLHHNGLLFLSGFYAEDLDAVNEKAISSGLEYLSHLEENKWIAASYRKK